MNTNATTSNSWVGGFPPANSPMLYPNPDLSSLPMLGNMDNINFLQRQLGIKWPEFSWETEKGKLDPRRCFQQFAPYISRIGYTNEGRIYSIICPQQGIWLGKELCMNAEITVTGNRGWVNETTKELAADMTVEAKIWFSPSKHQGDKINEIWPLLKYSMPKFPLDKDNAIRVMTHLPGNVNQPIFPIRKGETSLFESPDFAKHTAEAFTVGNIEVEIGAIRPLGDPIVDEFNTLVMEAFNLASGNMLQNGNVLSWNLWFIEPATVSIPEWKNHANFWRTSIDAHHGSPTGPGTSPRYFDGTYFNVEQHAVDQILQDIIAYVKKHI